MYPYRYSSGTNWQYFEAKDARSALKFACKQGLQLEQLKLQTTIDGTTDQWVDCSHLQDDRNYMPVVGPDGTRYESATEAAARTGHGVPSISRWANKRMRGWELAEVARAVS